jgi:hypothetical protein
MKFSTLKDIVLGIFTGTMSVVAVIYFVRLLIGKREILNDEYARSYVLAVVIVLGLVHAIAKRGSVRYKFGAAIAEIFGTAYFVTQPELLEQIKESKGLLSIWGVLIGGVLVVSRLGKDLLDAFKELPSPPLPSESNTPPVSER